MTSLISSAGGVDGEVDDVLGAEAAGEVEPSRDRVDGDHRGAGEAEQLGHEQAGDALAEHGDDVTDARCGVVDGVEGDRPDAGEHADQRIGAGGQERGLPPTRRSATWPLRCPHTP